MTIYLFKYNAIHPFSCAAEALVKYYHLPVEIVDTSKDNSLFEKHFPVGHHGFPAIYDSEKDFCLRNSVAVNEYIMDLIKEKNSLRGTKPEDKYKVIMWENIANTEVVLPIIPTLLKKFRSEEITTAEIDMVLPKLEKGLAVFDNCLKHNTYLVGEELSIADLHAAGDFYAVMTHIAGPEMRAKFRSVVRWYTTVMHSKYYTHLVDQISFAPQNVQPQAAQAAKPAAKSEAKPAQNEAAKPAASQAKPAHPLAALGKSSVPLDELKRQYSNTETREEALPWFWNNFFNEDEWSLWKVDYKYNDELTLTFMSNNLIGGFFNRLTESIKYIFGAAVVYGENNNNGIEGAFVVRGKDFLPAFGVAPDWESFEFTRLDPKKPEDRALLEDLWAWDKPLIIDGKPREIADGKVLK